MTKTAKTLSGRLLSLDVLRGITIAGMIMVNNPGSWSHIYAPLEHASWNGLTPTDLVFPFFMFIMGASMYMSYRKFDFKLSSQTFTKLLRRSVLLFLIGLGLGWFGLFCRGFHNPDFASAPLLEKIWKSASNLEHIRILGVLQRLALVSFFGSLIVLSVRPKRIPWVIGFILLFYWILMAATNSYAASEDSLVAVIDRAVLGVNHMYTDHLPDGTSLVLDPEGLLSTLPCFAHVLLGFLAGKIIAETKDHHEKIQKLFLFGTVILFIGFLLDYGFPINKKIWTSSFVLTTCGLASLLLSLLIYVIDIKGKKKWSVFFESFGVNPMFIYVMAGLLSILLGNLGFTIYGEWVSLKGFAYGHVLQPVFGDLLGSLIFALSFVGVNWLIGNILYKKKIYIKI